MLRHKIPYFLLIVSTCLFARTPALIYSKEDLNILYKNRQYTEFLAHAKDIRPTLRDNDWANQVLEMAQQFIEDVNQNKEYSTYNKNEINRLMSLGNVNQNEVFALLRKDFMAGHIEDCFKNHQTNCTQLAQDILNNTKMQREIPDIPARFGLILLQNGVTSPEVIHPFMKFSFISERSQFLCRKNEVKNYILRWFKAFNSKSRSDKEIKIFSADNFHPSCIKTVLNHFVSNFSFLQSPLDREQIIYWLNATEYLNRDEIRTLLAIYLLKNPVNGDVFNLAWNSLKELGENFTFRKPVINKLKSLDPLPDGIFGLSDPLREKTLFSLVSKNLPEYVEYYSQSCFQYYSGIKTFPNGNPTINCKEFLRLFKDKYGSRHPRTKKLEKILQF